MHQGVDDRHNRWRGLDSDRAEVAQRRYGVFQPDSDDRIVQFAIIAAGHRDGQVLDAAG